MYTQDEKFARDGYSSRPALFRLIGLTAMLAILWSAGLNRVAMAFFDVLALIALGDFVMAWQRARDGRRRAD